MCGILVSARHHYRTDPAAPAAFQKLIPILEQANGQRGPDAQSRLRIYIVEASQQAVVSSSSNAACLAPAADSNDVPVISAEFFASELRLRGDTSLVQPHQEDGDVFCWNGEVFDGLNVAPSENDGVKLFQAIRTLESPVQLPQIFAGIEGPYAFVYYHAMSKLLFFARDPLGRRSLLFHRPSTDALWFLLSSVSAGHDPSYSFEELPTDAIYCLNLAEWADAPNALVGFDSAFAAWPRDQEGAPYARLREMNDSLPPDGPSLVRSLDVVPEPLTPAVDEFIALLNKSVMLRVRDIPRVTVAKGEARVAVLFSGGIDSTILAFLAHRHIPLDEPLDLLNVAFENPRKIQLQSQGNVGGLPKRRKRERNQVGLETSPGNPFDVPDRLTGLDELEELRHLCPGRKWNFVEVNIFYEESQSVRSVIEALMWPGRTVMDMSLAMALYFASRGVGQVRVCKEAEPVPYASPARVLLNGLGSDELLGGYGRYRTAFSTGGWPAVVYELQSQLDRLPTRNLGRDDRVVSSHGKEMRHPFLSLEIVTFLARLRVDYKLDPRLELGIGDKMLLRLASRKLGLIEASSRKKRAMQFGSHAAKMESGAAERNGDAFLT